MHYYSSLLTDSPPNLQENSKHEINKAVSIVYVGAEFFIGRLLGQQFVGRQHVGSELGRTEIFPKVELKQNYFQISNLNSNRTKKFEHSNSNTFLKIYKNILRYF